MKPVFRLAALFVAGAALVPLAVVAAEPGAGESARFNDWLNARYAEDLERSPMAKTFRGVIDYDYDEWDDLSPAFQEESYRIGQRQLREMRQRFDYRKLDEQARLSWKLFEYDKLRDEAGFPFREHVYTFNQMRGVQTQIPAFLINQHRVAEVAHAEAYIDRLQGVDEYLGQALENARRRFVQDIYPPRFVYEHVLRDARNVIRGAPFDREAERTRRCSRTFSTR